MRSDRQDIQTLRGTQYLESQDSTAQYSSRVYLLSEAAEEAEGLCDFLSRAIQIISETYLVKGLLICITVFPLIMLGVGGKNLQECPIQPKIPVYLLVGGAAGLLKCATLLWKLRKTSGYEKFDDFGDSPGIIGRSTQASESLITLFILIWWIMGNVWLFEMQKPVHFIPTIEEPNNFCSQSAYSISFVSLILGYCIIGVEILTALTLMFYYRWIIASPPSEPYQLQKHGY